MAHGTSFTAEDIKEIVEAKPLSVPAWFRLALIILAILGLLAFLVELFTGDAKRAWMALQINMLYWVAVSAASSCFTAVFHICNAQWARPIRRIFESGVFFFSLTPIFLVVMYFGHEYLFVWAHEQPPGKGPWLTSNFVFVRDIIALLVLGYFARKVVGLSVMRDLAALRDNKFKKLKLSSEASKRWKDEALTKLFGLKPCLNAQNSSHYLSRFSPAVVIFYAFMLTFFAFDQLMSVDPVWYSTLYGVMYFMTGVYLSMAFTSMLVGICTVNNELFLQKIKRKTLHDLGKLLFGFGIFWAYMFWSHYLPIWYGNLPEETAWVILRLREEPWRNLAWMVLGMNFIIPFFLGLSRDVKQVPQLLFGTGAIVAIGCWLQMYLLFAPTLYPHEITLGLVDYALGIGLFALYVLLAVKFLSKVPLIPFGDLEISKEH